MSREPEMGNVRLKNNMRKRLCENVCSVINAGSMLDDKGIGF